MKHAPANERVAEIIRGLPMPLRQRVNRVFKWKRNNRYLEDLSRPELKVGYMVWKKAKVPYRPLEKLMHLQWNSGNNAQRVIRMAKKIFRKAKIGSLARN